MWFQRNIPYISPIRAGQNRSRRSWWSAVVEGIRELVPETDREKVAGLSFGGQMHGLVMLDENDEVSVLRSSGMTEEPEKRQTT